MSEEASNESELEMVRRHVRLGEEHVRRQREIVAKGFYDIKLARTSRQLLATFEASLADHRAHLERLSKKT